MIRVRAGTFNENVVVTDKNIELIGGHQFCFGEQISGRTVIDATGTGQTALALRAQTGPVGREYRLVVRNFELTGGYGNAGEAGAGADVFAASGGVINLMSSLVHRGAGPNGLFDAPSGPNPYTFWIENNAALGLLYSTVVDTQPVIAVIRFGGDDAVAFLTGSIIHEQSGIAIQRTNVGNDPYVETECMMWHSGALAELRGSHVFNAVDDPQFVNREAGNFQLTKNSPAVDYCAPGAAPVRLDLLLRQRGIQTKTSVLHGPWDLGAFEVQPDAMFSDRFENP